MLFRAPLLRFLISIHALRKESDLSDEAFVRSQLISIHALRKESDKHDATW